MHFENWSVAARDCSDNHLCHEPGSHGIQMKEDNRYLFEAQGDGSSKSLDSMFWLYAI